VKYLGADYPAALQTFYRQAVGLLVLTPLIVRDWRRALSTTRPWTLLFRSSCGVLGTILSFYSFQKMPLADANALSFTRPLWLTPMAFFFLGEKLSPARIIVCIVGFAGVMVMLAPSGHQHLGLPQAAALTSALLFAMTIVGMKVMTRDHSPFTILVYSALLGVLFSTPPALFVWRWPHLTDLFLLAAMGGLAVLNQALFVKGIQVGDAAALAPIDYSRLVFGVAVGFFLFKETPGPRTLFGAVIVVGSTLYLTLREQHIARRAQKAEAVATAA
jgi:drug/metabolite transporter (DMT)-like permease